MTDLGRLFPSGKCLLECKAFDIRIKVQALDCGNSVHYVNHKFHVPVAVAAVYRAGTGIVAGLRWRDNDFSLPAWHDVGPDAETLYRQPMPNVVGNQDEFGWLAFLQCDLARGKRISLGMHHNDRWRRLFGIGTTGRSRQANRKQQEQKGPPEGTT